MNKDLPLVKVDDCCEAPNIVHGKNPDVFFQGMAANGEWKTIGKAKESKRYNLVFECEDKPKEKVIAENIVKIGKNHNWHITNLEKTNTSRSPKAPFTTSTLQQSASSRLGFSPSRTMMTAQKL
jgi:DNA topoisomerase IA